MPSGLDVTPRAPPLRLGSWRQSREDDTDQIPLISAEEHQKQMDVLRSVPMIDLATLSGTKKTQKRRESRNTPVTPTRSPATKVSLLQTPPDSNSQISLLPDSQTFEPPTPSGSAGPRTRLFGGPLFNSQYDVDSTVDDILQFMSDDLL